MRSKIGYGTLVAVVLAVLVFGVIAFADGSSDDTVVASGNPHETVPPDNVKGGGGGAGCEADEVGTGLGVRPLIIEDEKNPTDCKENRITPHGSQSEYTFTNGDLEVTVTITDWKDGSEPTEFEFTANQCIDRVIVKASKCAVEYVYPEGTESDTGLRPPAKDDGQFYGISHIDFCATGSPCAPVPEVSSMGLMALGLLALGGFVFLRRRAATEPVEIS